MVRRHVYKWVKPRRSRFPYRAPQKGNKLTSCYVTLRRKMGGVHSRRNPVFKSPENRLVIEPIGGHIYKGGFCTSGLRAALRPPEESHNLSPCAVGIRHEMCSIYPRCDSFLHSPKHRFIIEPPLFHIHKWILLRLRVCGLRAEGRNRLSSGLVTPFTSVEPVATFCFCRLPSLRKFPVMSQSFHISIDVAISTARTGMRCISLICAAGSRYDAFVVMTQRLDCPGLFFPAIGAGSGFFPLFCASRGLGLQPVSKCMTVRTWFLPLCI